MTFNAHGRGMMYVKTALLSTHNICFSLHEHEMLKVSYWDLSMSSPSYLPKIALNVNSHAPPILTKLHRNDPQKKCMIM